MPSSQLRHLESESETEAEVECVGHAHTRARARALHTATVVIALTATDAVYCVPACVARTSAAEYTTQVLDALRHHVVELDATAAMRGYLTMRLQHPLALAGCALLMLAQNAAPRSVYWNQAQVRRIALSGCSQRHGRHRPCLTPCAWRICFPTTEHDSERAQVRPSASVLDASGWLAAAVPHWTCCALGQCAGVAEPGAGASVLHRTVRGSSPSHVWCEAALQLPHT